MDALAQERVRKRERGGGSRHTLALVEIGITLLYVNADDNHPNSSPSLKCVNQSFLTGRESRMDALAPAGRGNLDIY